MSRRSMTVHVARWSATHPWRAIGLWLLLVGAGPAPRTEEEREPATV